MFIVGAAANSQWFLYLFFTYVKIVFEGACKRMNFLNIFNLWGLLFSALLAAPHIVFYKTRTIDRSRFTNRAMVYIDRTGRFFSLFLMSFNIGVLEGGFTEPVELMKRFWLITTACLTAAYLLLWLLIFKKESKGAALAVVLISAFIIIFSGILQVKTLLLTAGIVYLVGELYMFKRYFG